MDPNLQNPKEKYPGGGRLLKLVIRAVYRQLPTSFYLALAMMQTRVRQEMFVLAMLLEPARVMEQGLRTPATTTTPAPPGIFATGREHAPER